MDRKYKHILPALRPPTAHSDSGEQSSSSSSAPKRKRIYVKTACDICRIKKTACDGQRPACTPCAKRKSSCTFSGRPAGSDELRSPSIANVHHDSDSASIITALLTAHDDEAHELLDRMRQGRGTLEVLGPWAEEEAEAAKRPTILAPDQTSLEYELMVRHPIAYPALVPLDSHSENPSILDRLQMAQDRPVELEQDGGAEKEVAVTENWVASNYGSYEQRLRHIHFVRWTNVPVSGIEAASAIANYLAHDHVLLQLFDTEVFLRDVAHDYGDFCSSLLVNALLGWSLPSIAIANSENRDPAGVAYETALRQLEAQGDRPASLGVIAAVELLTLTALFRGEGPKAKSLLRHAIYLGQQLGLLSHIHHPSFLANNGPVSGDAEDRPKAIASWGIFSLATMLSFYCQCNELDPSIVPTYPFPEPAATESSSLTAVIPKQMGRLWAMVHEINSHYHRGGQNVSHEVGASFVTSMLARLLQWADDLPVMLARGNRSTQEVMIMHVFFHATIMTLTHPLALRQEVTPLIEGESMDRSAQAFYAASAAQMHRLVDMYRFQSRILTSNVFWHTALLFSANFTIRNSSGTLPIRRWRFLRAMDGYADLHSRYPVMQPIFRGLMTMAVEAGLIGSQEAVKLAKRLMREDGPGKATEVVPTETCFVVDLEMALINRGMAVVDVLSQRFDEIIMFDDFTHEYREH